MDNTATVFIILAALAVGYIAEWVVELYKYRKQQKEKAQKPISLTGIKAKILVRCPIETCRLNGNGRCTNDEVNLCTLINGYDHEGLYCRNYQCNSIINERA